jgi:hypothetical protein
MTWARALCESAVTADAALDFHPAAVTCGSAVPLRRQQDMITRSSWTRLPDRSPPAPTAGRAG